MKNTLTKILFVFAILLPINNYCQNIVSTDDLKTLLGEWTGTLTYTDYRSNKPFTMPANLIVSQGKSNRQFILNINYPNEPNANSRDKIRISKDGTQLNRIDVKSKQSLPNGHVQITTQYSGKDNRKQALIKNIYTIGTYEFIIRKEVKFENSDDWLMRSEYKYVR